jgi:hypothetical protein
LEQHEIQSVVLFSVWTLAALLPLARMCVILCEESRFALQPHFAIRFERMPCALRFEESLSAVLQVEMVLCGSPGWCAPMSSEILTLGKLFLMKRCAPSLQICLPRVREQQTRESIDLRLARLPTCADARHSHLRTTFGLSVPPAYAEPEQMWQPCAVRSSPPAPRVLDHGECRWALH